MSKIYKYFFLVKNIRRNIITLIADFVIFMMCVAPAELFGAIVVTPPVNGQNICSNSAANGNLPSFTTLNTVTISEGLAADINFNSSSTSLTLVLVAPVGWQFNPSSTITYGFTNGSNITLVSSSSLTSSALTITITGTKTNAFDAFTINGLQVKASSVGSSIGNITSSSATGFSGITTASTNFGTLSLNVTPAPAGTSSQPFCAIANPTIANLAATGTAIQWYAASSGGTALVSTTALVNGTHYYASQTVSGCEGTARLDVTAVVNNPAAPTGTASQSFCAIANPTIANLAATGTAIQWYAASSGGTALVSTTALVNGTHYYASQTVSGCEGIARFDVTVIVNNPVIIITQPKGASVCATTPVSFSVAATGDGLTYQWYKNNVALTNTANISGATSNTLKYLQADAADNSALYHVVVNGISPCSPVTSSPDVVLTVDQKINITQDLAYSASVCEKGSITFTVAASPSDVLSYQWRKNSKPIGGETNTTLTIATVSLSDVGNYDVVISGPAIYSCPTAYSHALALTVYKLPAVTSASSGIICNATAQNYSITSDVPGTNYNWSRSTVAGITEAGVSSQTSNPITEILTNTTTTPIDVSYIISPAANSCPGSQFTYTITVNPTATVTAITNQTVCNAAPTTAITFGSPTTGGTIVYNWTNNTPSIGLVASGSGNIASFTATNATGAPVTATITVTPSYTNTSTCAGTASSLTITVNPTTAISVQPSSAPQSLCLNGVATSLSVTASGINLTYQWYSNAASSNIGGTAISGAMSSSYTPLATTADTLYYYVIVSGTCTPLVTSAVSGRVIVNSLPLAGSIAIKSSSNSSNPSLLCSVTNTNPSNSALITLSGASGTVVWQISTDGGTTWNPAPGSQTSLTVSNLLATTIYRASITNGSCSTPVYSNIVVLQLIPAIAPTNPLANPKIVCQGGSSVLTADATYLPTGITAQQGLFNGGASDDKVWNVYKPDGSIDKNALNAGGDNSKGGWWSETNGPQPIIANGITYNSPDNKFAIVSGAYNTILESPIFSLIGVTSTVFSFSQAYNLTNGAVAKVEISTNGGTSYTALDTYTGPAIFGNISGSNNTVKNYSIDLSNYLGISNLRIRFNYQGNSLSAWALDNISTPGAALPISYAWAGNQIPIGTTTNNPVTAYPQQIGDNIFTISSMVGGCPGGSVDVHVLVNPNPTLGPISQAPVCSGGNATIALTGLLPNTTSSIVYNIAGGAAVTVIGIASDGSGNGSFTVPVTSAQNGQVLTITSITGNYANGISCPVTLSRQVTLVINPLPTATIAGTTTLCQNDPAPSVTLTGASSSPQYTFTYAINGVTQPTVTSSGNPATFTLSAPTGNAGTFNYTLISVKDGSVLGCTNAQAGTATVTINPKASITTPPANVLACPEGTVNFTVNANGAPSYTWDVSTDNGVSWNPVSGTDYTGQTTSTLNVLNITFGNTKDGYLYRTNVVASAACPVTPGAGRLTIHNIWHGYTNTDWNTGSNWSDGSVPTLSCDSVIILNVANKQPILSPGANGYTNHLVMRPGATVTVTGNTLHIAGGIFNDNMSLNATTGKIDLNGNKWLDGVTQRPAQTIAGKMFATPYNNNSGRVMDLQISNPTGATVAAPTLNDTLNITGTLSFGNVNNVILNTKDNITLVSDQQGTARVADITNSKSNTGNNFNGLVEVERYVNIGPGATQHGQAYEFLATPTIGQTVYQSWMESGPKTATGYGTQITSPTGSGFDRSSLHPSMRYYVPGSSPFDIESPDWLGITSTGNQIYASSGYMLFVWGDRSISKSFVTLTGTRMRTKGNLFTYTVKIPVAANTLFTSVGNPYASTIDMSKVLAQSSVDQYFSAWKAPDHGAYGWGTWATYALNQNGEYEPTPGGLPNNDVQSGQAFFIQTAGGAGGQVVFNETSKSGSSSNLIFTPAGILTGFAQFRTNLYGVRGNGTASLVDGTLNQYSDSYSNDINGGDARKLFNASDNLFIRSGGKDIIVEQRHTVNREDTIFFRFTTPTYAKYRFEFIAQSMSANAPEGYLVDNYLHTSTTLNMEGVTQLDFNIENTSGSKDPARFYVVFKPAIALPVTFVSVKAFVVSGGIMVNWKVNNETNMQRYEVERSYDGLQFFKIATVAAANTGANDYNSLDGHILPGYNYYRIRSVDITGKVQYTSIVKVLIGNGQPSITIYPNPIIDGTINLHFNNLPAGKYGIRLMNQIGQVIVSRQVERTDGSHIENIKWNYNLAHGVYRLEILEPGGEIKEIKVLY
jgi:hypothetical protein